jgi:dienelactone hydrolase
MPRDDVEIPVGGDTLAAWLYRPEGSGGPVPGVVLMHGFTATRDEQLDRFCERFAEAGLAALAFDFRHFGASGGEPRQLLDVGRQYEDCDAALDYMRGREDVDASRIAVWGTSFAGGHAIDAAARHPWLRAAIAQTPFTDGRVPAPGMTPRKALWAVRAGLRDQARAWRGREPFLVPVLGPPGSGAVLDSQDAWEGFRDLVPAHSKWRNEVAARLLLRVGMHRPIKRAPRVGCPLLVQVAELETVARPEPARRAAELAPRGTLKEYAGLHHFDVYTGDGFERSVADQLAFLREHLLDASG